MGFRLKINDLLGQCCIALELTNVLPNFVRVRMRCPLPVFSPMCIMINFLTFSQILLYELKSSAKFRKRSMPIRDLNKSSDCFALAEKVKKRHEKYLGGVVAVRIEKLLRILQVTMTGESMKGALNIVDVGRFKFQLLYVRL